MKSLLCLCFCKLCHHLYGPVCTAVGIPSIFQGKEGRLRGCSSLLEMIAVLPDHQACCTAAPTCHIMRLLVHMRCCPPAWFHQSQGSEATVSFHCRRQLAGQGRRSGHPPAVPARDWLPGGCGLSRWRDANAANQQLKLLFQSELASASPAVRAVMCCFKLCLPVLPCPLCRRMC